MAAIKNMYMNKIVRFVGYGATSLVLVGCYVEGNSHLLASGNLKYFQTMKRCEEEAKTKFSDGSPKYLGFECRKKVLFFTTEKRDYDEGKFSSQSGQ